jgi:hypothetical protein
MKTVVVLVAALALVAAAGASTPSVSSMTLQAAELPGAKVTKQGAVKEQGYLAAFDREFQLAKPYGTSRIVFLQNEVMLAPSIDKATADVKAIKQAFASKTGKKLLISSVAAETHVKPGAVVVGKLRAVPGWDDGFELPVSVKTKLGRIYENLAYLRIDRVVTLLGETGLHGITAGNTAHFATLIATHIQTALTPVSTAPPAITGTAQQGQTLTATPGTWTADDAVKTYQWQHCDPAGANCADIAGATAQTYTVAPTDAGATLRVVEKATNRFGSPTATSAQTTVVT